LKSLTVEISALYQKSNIILDINHPGQKGLTVTFGSEQENWLPLILKLKKYPLQSEHILGRRM
jgi:hypothetical protein